jgi:hypothetical protein
MDGQPGDKSPGYYRASLRDEVKTGFQMSKLERSHSFDLSLSPLLSCRRSSPSTVFPNGGQVGCRQSSSSSSFSSSIFSSLVGSLGCEGDETLERRVLGGRFDPKEIEDENDDDEDDWGCRTGH